MDDFLLKPFRKEELTDTITKWLPSAPPSEPVGKSSGELSETTDDVAKGLKQLEEDYGKEMVLNVVQMFIPDAEERIAQIDGAIKQENFRALEESAHGLKGGAANIGATEMAELCNQLETRGERGVIGDAPEIMEKLVKSWTRVKTQLTEYH